MPRAFGSHGGKYKGKSIQEIMAGNKSYFTNQLLKDNKINRKFLKNQPDLVAALRSLLDEYNNQRAGFREVLNTSGIFDIVVPKEQTPRNENVRKVKASDLSSIGNLERRAPKAVFEDAAFDQGMPYGDSIELSLTSTDIHFGQEFSEDEFRCSGRGDVGAKGRIRGEV
ncbi:hypothetical protein K458DRAFT_491964 [Lentithecium fluviatile CBS 122367]|uniref:Uncharacterized protein n=1 Tax=Lentithecium fluviatile CBS 122367 TaxID=1168545 RepID=A0A6G1IGL3_9PLEO|nr:hypothetical protein K458DRAFT_491964 [Lentithecium fluviatile CBS 122367]